MTPEEHYGVRGPGHSKFYWSYLGKPWDENEIKSQGKASLIEVDYLCLECGEKCKKFELVKL